MSSFFDEHETGGFELPYPPGEDPLTPADELSVGEKSVTKAPCKKWELHDVRCNDGLGKDKDRFVINFKIKGLDEDYSYMGDVAFWFGPGDFVNPANPAYKKAARLGSVFVDLGMSDMEAWKAGIGFTEIRDLLLNAARRNLVGKPTLRGSLIWSRRKFVGNDGEAKVYDENASFTPWGVEKSEQPF